MMKATIPTSRRSMILRLAWRLPISSPTILASSGHWRWRRPAFRSLLPALDGFRLGGSRSGRPLRRRLTGLAVDLAAVRDDRDFGSVDRLVLEECFGDVLQ